MNAKELQPLSDRTLIEYINLGPADKAQYAFEQLVVHHGLHLQNHLRMKGLASEEMGDISQETWMRAYERIARFEYHEEVGFYPWLRAIADNVIKEHLRNVRRPNVLSLEVDNVSLAASAVPDPERSPDERMHLSEVREKLDEILREAPPDFRDVINAKFFDEFNPEEISQLYGWSMSKVYTTTHRAVSWLRKRLVDKYGTETATDWGN